MMQHIIHQTTACERVALDLKIRLRNRNEIYYFDLDGTLSRTDKFMIPSIELAMEK